MKTMLFGLLLLTCAIPAFAQKETPQAETQEEDLIYTVVEEQPEFPGGHEKMFEFIAQNLKYPKKARKKGIEGRVVVQFVVNEDGKLVNIKVIKGLEGGCSKEALRVVKKMPDWEPGVQRGKKVKVRFNLPIYFKLS